MQKPCQDSYYTLFSSYPTLLDYHEEQAKNSRWIRCKVADLQVEPLSESSPLIGNLSAFAAGTSQEAVEDTAENLGLAMRLNGELYPVRMTAYKSLLDRAKIGGTALPKLSREVLAEVLNECLKLYSADALLLIRDEKISAVHSGDEVDYSVLPIDELLKALQAKLDARFSGNEFESGYCDHSLVSASWRILSPLEYKRSKGMPYKTSFKTKSKAQWTPVAVRRILTNPVYVGTLVQGIRTRPNYKIKTVIVNEQDKWAIYENAHEAIINPRQFVLVQRLLELDTRTSPRENGLFPLAGLLCCGDCGGAMVRKTQTSGNKRFCYYTCSNHKNTGECTSHRISQKQLEDAVLRLLQEHIRVLAELDGCLQTIHNAPVHRLSIRKAEDRLAAVEADIDRYRKLKISAYEDMRDGILSKEDYLDIKEQYEMRISEAQLAEEQIRHEIDLYIENGNAPQRWIQEFLDHRNIQSLTRIVAVECIDHIMIYEGKRIEVTFAHMQDYEALVSRMKDYYINQREVG